jgi:hypothetical protein
MRNPWLALALCLVARATFAPTGVDDQASVLLSY